VLNHFKGMVSLVRVRVRVPKPKPKRQPQFYLRGAPGLAVVFSFLLNVGLLFDKEFNISVTQHEQDILDGPSIIVIKTKNVSLFGLEEEKRQQEESGKPFSHSSASDSFSACILWMDDNHRLEEWLAYHYYIMQLRYVVINIDPTSRTSPKSIIDRWNDHGNRYNLNMTIFTMVDSDYIHDYSFQMDKLEKLRLSNAKDSASYGNQKTGYHRFRQRHFYKACSQHLVEQNQSWTSYHDIDEFVTFDWVTEKEEGKVKVNITEDGIRKMKQPGYVLHRLNSMKKQFPPENYVNATGLSCLVIRRQRFCSKELSPKETNQLFSSGEDIPEGFMNSYNHSSTDEDRHNILRRFDTLRYTFLTPGYDGLPKSIIDLSQKNPQLYTQGRFFQKEEEHSWQTHKPMHGLCVKEQQHRDKEIQKVVGEEKFIISHYLGNWASYSFRDDARKGGLRTYEIWAERANLTRGEYSYVIRPWLRGFVELVGGPGVASYLLQDAQKYPEGHNATSRIEEYLSSYKPRRGRTDKKQKRRRKRNK